MRTLSTGLGFLAVSCLLVMTVSGRADEKKIALDKVPKAVLDAVKAKFVGAEITAATKETENGKTIFEIAFGYEKHKYEVECEPDGTIVAIDKQLEVKELPDAVAKTLEEKYPNAKLNLIEEVTKTDAETKKDKIAYYEVELVTADKKEVEIQIGPDGKVQKEEKKDK